MGAAQLMVDILNSQIKPLLLEKSSFLRFLLGESISPATLFVTVHWMSLAIHWIFKFSTKGEEPFIPKYSDYLQDLISHMFLQQTVDSFKMLFTMHLFWKRPFYPQTQNKSCTQTKRPPAQVPDLNSAKSRNFSRVKE